MRVDRIIVFFAVSAEAGPFRRLACQRDDVRVTLTGIGRPAAGAVARQILAPRNAVRVISSGFAGGLDPLLSRGTVLFDADGGFEGRQAFLSAGARQGRFHTADRVIVTREEKQALRRASGADAVDMESAVIREICREHGIPGATVRVISDSATESLPLDFNQCLDTTGRIRLGPLVLALARSPARVRQLLRFQRRLRAGAESLAKVLISGVRGEGEG